MISSSSSISSSISSYLTSFESNYIKLKIIEINNLIETENIFYINSFNIKLKNSTSLILNLNIITLLLDIQTNIKEKISIININRDRERERERIQNNEFKEIEQEQEQEQEQEIEFEQKQEQLENKIKKQYIYTRFSERYVIEIITSNENEISEQEKEEIEIFEFYLQQFCRYNFISNNLDSHLSNNFNSSSNNDQTQDIHNKKEEKRKVNAVAKGAESTGFLLRKGLKEGGKSAGDIIRYINNVLPVSGEDESSSLSNSNEIETSQSEYTSLLDSENITTNNLTTTSSQPKRKLTEAEIAAEEKRAEYFRQQAETIHTYTKTATSAIMLPIRMMGRKAVELAQPTQQEEDGWKKAVMDTVGGCGNGIMSIAKGFTEGLQEMGQAIEEVTMQRAIEKYGPEYAERVTRKYLSAGSEGARAAIKTVSVASMGFHGFVAGMAIEGVDYAVNLKDYLVGPVILQNYMQVLQYPLTKSVRYFTVLRPWCLAFYYHHSEFSLKPHKIIATSNLDTIPKLREEKIKDPITGDIIINHFIEIATLDGSTYALRLDSTLSPDLNWFNSNDIIDQLHHHSTIGSDVIFEWFNQIQDGSRRMETVRKQQSGAKEVGEERWLKRSPRGIGWKWNDDDNIPEVINEDFIYTFSLHSLYISTNQLKEAIQYDSKTQYTEAEAVNQHILVDGFIPEHNNEQFNYNNNNDSHNTVTGMILPLAEDEEDYNNNSNFNNDIDYNNNDIELTPEYESLVKSFSDIFGVSRSEAIQQLTNSNWDINHALDSYEMLSSSSSPPSNLPSSPPSYHSVVAVPIDNATAINVSGKKSSILKYPPSVNETAKALKSSVKSDISSVSVTLKIVTISGLRIKLATTEWTSLTLPSNQSLLSGNGSYRQAIWTPPIIFEIGKNMRIHRDTCSAIELHVTANTKMGIRYKIGTATLTIESLTYDQQVGPALLPLYKHKKNGDLESTHFMIGEMNLDITRKPFCAYTE